MLFRDLDIVNLLEMIKDYHLMKQVLFTEDDRFFLQLQHRDMICTSSDYNSDSDDQNDSKSIKKSATKAMMESEKEVEDNLKL